MRLEFFIPLPCTHGFALPVYSDGEEYYFHELKETSFEIKSFVKIKGGFSGNPLPFKKRKDFYNIGDCGAVVFCIENDSSPIAGKASVVANDIEAYLSKRNDLPNIKNEFETLKQTLLQLN